MSRLNVSAMSPGMSVNDCYLVKEKELLNFSNRDGRYLSLVLGDASGDVKGIMWENAEAAAVTFQTGDIVRVQGEVSRFRGRIQIIIEAIIPAGPGDYRIDDFIPSTDRDVGQMVARLQEIIDSVSDPFLQQLLDSFFGDSDSLQQFATAPAAKSMHQAYLGGLLEHTLNVVELCLAAARLYPEADRDLLITGALLHDIGKLSEYQYDRVIDLTDEGRLLGHVVLGAEAVARQIREIPGFPKARALQIRHMIIAHQGQLEWGSPKRPKTLEALILHHADNFDAQAVKFIDILRDLPEGEKWSKYDRHLGRMLYAGETDNEGERQEETG